MKCNRCSSTGTVLIYENTKYKIYEVCYKCNGTKRIDWLTEIFVQDQSYIPIELVDPWSIINRIISSKRRDNIFKKRKIYNSEFKYVY